jgi:hypothetical protein
VSVHSQPSATACSEHSIESMMASSMPSWIPLDQVNCGRHTESTSSASSSHTAIATHGYTHATCHTWRHTCHANTLQHAASAVKPVHTLRAELTALLCNVLLLSTAHFKKSRLGSICCDSKLTQPSAVGKESICCSQGSQARMRQDAMRQHTQQERQGTRQIAATLHACYTPRAFHPE